MENKKKSVRVGNLLTVTGKDGEKRKSIKLGNENSPKPEYNFTVEMRVKDAQGKVVAKVTNPWINLGTPHPNAPKSILNELAVFVEES